MEEEDTVYVAVGKDVNESKLTLSWALRNFGGDNFCILHVHQLPQTITSYSFNFLFLLCVGLDLKNMNPSIYLIARLCEKSRKVLETIANLPSYFICPILLEVMQDPVVAADGYTYEAEAMKGWLGSRHDTSPMTNLRLPYHQVIPNHSLRSAIQEWLDIPT
ncbi:hypothetical protein Q3G72_014780 [Acer saccharum]|nr:hypothetical protein Q3G72_014780 [Acer saccharum]